MIEAILKKEIIISKALCRTLGVVTFIILTSLGAFVRIPLPFTPVPLTLQTFFVLLSGALLGSNLGAITQFSYIIIGIAGVPVFSGAGSGWLYLFGPTGGYLLGFVLAAFFLGRFIRPAKQNLLFTFGLFFLADLILLSCGALWLKFLFGWGLTKSLYLGLIPFLPGDLLKIIAAMGFYARLKKIKI